MCVADTSFDLVKMAEWPPTLLPLQQLPQTKFDREELGVETVETWIRDYASSLLQHHWPPGKERMRCTTALEEIDRVLDRMMSECQTTNLDRYFQVFLSVFGQSFSQERLGQSVVVWSSVFSPRLG